ncbi:MAG: hypothetical protein WAQ24_00950 [Candidatus Saccharimonadales bacterium]
MQAVLLGVTIIVVCFALVVFVGAPYLPTLKPQIQTAIKLLNVEPGQTVLELGSGDGKVMLAMAQAGLHVVGIEVNPLLVMVSWWRTRKYRNQVQVIWGSFWNVSWPPSDGVFVFLLDRFMPKLDARMRNYKGPIVSIAFKIPLKNPVREENGVYLYEYS